MRTKLLAVLALLPVSTCASAADLGTAPAPRAYAPAVVDTVYSWTGVYIGVQAGGGWSSHSGFDPTNPADGTSTVTSSGALAGGQLGFNYQIGNVVLGAEGSYAWSGISVGSSGPFGAGTLTMTVKNDYVATATGRVGYAFDRVLVYGKGGAAWTRDKADGNDGLGDTITGRFNRVGWLAGAGVEYAFLQNWSVKLEYDYMRFGQINEILTTTGGLTASPALVKMDLQTALIGLNYRF